MGELQTLKSLEHILRKKRKLVVGLMSGTSADGIDTVLVQVDNSGVRTRVRQRAFVACAYPMGFRKFLLENSDPRTARLDDIARLNVLVGEFFAEAAGSVARKAGKSLSTIDLIGSHGQTIGHFPRSKKLFGRNVRGTIQIGDLAVIAKRTGVVTIGDFRTGDVAVGGSGAPLVPYVDYLLFRSAHKARALLNIGGIANITILPPGGGVDDVVAFDTGPGNMIIDALAQLFFREDHDVDGRIATRGRLLPALLQWLMKNPYLRVQPPKSTGREMFGQMCVQEILRRSKGSRKEDVVTTVSAFTALAVHDSCRRFVLPRVAIDELFVSGGGARNRYIMELLARLFSGVHVGPVEELGVSGRAKEAIAFAILANEALVGNPANIRGATGAKRRTILGKICQP